VSDRVKKWVQDTAQKLLTILKRSIKSATNNQQQPSTTKSNQQLQVWSHHGFVERKKHWLILILYYAVDETDRLTGLYSTSDVVIISIIDRSNVAQINRTATVKCQISRSAYERRSRKVLRRCLKTDSDGAKHGSNVKVGRSTDWHDKPNISVCRLLASIRRTL